jgi:polyisoprenoid-binding protein YceI
MKSTLLALCLAAATAVGGHMWNVTQGDVRVICPMTIGGSFEARTTALSGSLTTSASNAEALDGTLAVDLRALDTGIGLRNQHLREKYLEVDKGQGFDTATLSEIDLKGFTVDAPQGKGSFTGLLTLHGASKPVSGVVDVHEMGVTLRVKASFPVLLSDYGIRKPRYLGVGVKDTVQVEVNFVVASVSPS